MTTIPVSGLATLTNGSKAVTIVGGNLVAAGVVSGLFFEGGGSYPIDEVLSNTEMTMKIPYAGVTGAGKEFAITGESAILATTTANANRLAEILNSLTPMADFSVFSTGLMENVNADGWLTGLEIPTVKTVSPTVLTGATTLTDADLGKTFVLGGSTDYTVTLPIAHPGNEGAMVYFEALLVNSAPLANFVSLVCSSMIDNYGTGAGQRVLWGRETALLRSTGSTWRKVGGHSIPMTGTLIAGAMTSLPGDDNILTNVEWDSHEFWSIDLLTPCYDDVNKRLKIPRLGYYRLTSNISVGATSGLTFARTYFAQNGTIYPFYYAHSMRDVGTLAQNVYGLEHSDLFKLHPGGWIDVQFNSNPGTTGFKLDYGRLNYQEIPEW